MIAHELIVAPPYAGEVAESLSRVPKSLPCKLFYDAAGSALFEEITRLPEYYLTRKELEILCERADDLAVSAGSGVTVVELGSGSAMKTCTLLQALAQRQMRVTYVPVDISPAALGEARVRASEISSRVRVRPVLADLADGFDFLDNSLIPGRKLVLYLGSSLGNLAPDAAISLLRGLRAKLASDDALLLGTDMVKDTAVLELAYDDPAGVTAKFNQNILHRLNRELGANFDLASFRHLALWNPSESRMEMHLESTRAQTVHLDLLSLPIELAAGERIHTENSYKYTMPMIGEIFNASGFAAERTWHDRACWYALHLARVQP